MNWESFTLICTGTSRSYSSGNAMVNPVKEYAVACNKFGRVPGVISTDEEITKVFSFMNSKLFNTYYKLKYWA